MTDKSLPRATHFGDLNLANSFAIPARVVEGENRILTETGLVSTFRSKPKALMQKIYDEGFVSKSDWKIICTRIPYSENGERRYGYSTRILGIMVKGVLRYDKNRPLTKAQQRRLQLIHVIRDALVDVAIDALVDECTGYQAKRPDDALQQLLEKYLQEHARKWAKTFPDEFWIKLARVRGIKNFELHHRPNYFGHLVNNIVYSRLAPNVLEELKRMNPRLSYGERANRHHQHLTEPHGLPELREHLVGVMILMDVYPKDWRQFILALNIARPKFGANYELDIYEDFEGVDYDGK